MEDVFGLDRKRTFHRRGEYWHAVGYADAAEDAIGRPLTLFTIPQRPGIPRARLHHLAFDVDDAKKAIEKIEERGFEVPVTDRIMFGPEGIWIQIDSFDAPFPRNHPTMQGGFVRLKEEEWPDGNKKK
jgi:hypothetical protein